PSKSLFNVKKSRLFHSAIPPTRTRKMESQRRPQYQEVFRTLHLVQRHGVITLRREKFYGTV
ncbi:hypothetical protein, partial [Komagataeibacter melomenusus]|uniref:hypothetical protein n=1 Tax=Komagataeibacter melomenusus TaxID=2766578 RepID=UPI001F511891